MSIGVQDRKKLWGLARNQCAYAQCSEELIRDLADADGAGTSAVVVGEEAHIRSGRPGGPRYDKNYGTTLIDNYENLILLCPTHHTVIDKENGRGFSVRDLVQIRRSHEQAAAKEDRLKRVYAAYLADQWRQDNRVLFEAVDLNGPSVDSMFIDVPIAAPSMSEAGQIVAAIHAAAPIDLEARDASHEFEIAGGAQVLLSPLWRGNALIQGGPGQGKSTLLQYVCQFHRSRLVAGKDDHYTGEAEGLKDVTSVARLPIRVDLRRFAAWLNARASGNDRRKAGGRTRPGPMSRNDADRPRPDPLATFLTEHIASRSGMQFGPEDLATLLVERSVLLAFDGLDEIASLKDRETASDIIVTSIPRLQAYATDLVVLVATRPGATDSSRWADADFTLMRLRPLSVGLKIQYLAKWCKQADVPQPRAEDLQEKLIENQSVPHVRELGSNPMQLAILLHLLYRRGLLPQQRTELYREYIKTFLDREEQDKEPLLHKHRQVIIDVHAYLAWYLQSRAETDQNPAGTLSRAELVEQVKLLLADSTESTKFADKLIAALTSRVLCLVERQTGQFEFEVQSLREYFAALHIYEEAPPRGAANSRDDCLSALLERPYWSNTMRFLVGMLSKGEVKALVTNLQARQHGIDARLDPYLRRVAAQLLDDRIYENQADSQIANVVDFILDGSGVVYAEDGLLDSSGLPLVLTEQAGALQVLEHVRRRLLSLEDESLRDFLATLFLRHASHMEAHVWAWENVGQELSERDLLLLTSLAALENLNQSQTSRLVRAVTGRTDQPTRWVLEVLARGGYNGNDPTLLGLAIGAVLDGAAESISYRRLLDRPGPLRTALSLGRLEPLASLPKLDAVGATAPAEGRVRQRTRGGKATTPNPGTILTAWRDADAAISHARNESNWKALVGAVRAAAPDSWLLRVVLTYAAQEVDLALGADASLDDGQTWRSHAAWAIDARSNSTVTAWWAANPPPSDSLSQRQWLLSAFAFAGTQVLLEVLPTLDRAVIELSLEDYEALHLALRRAAARIRTLNLLAPLKRDAVKVGPRTAALLVFRSDQESRRYLNRIVIDGSFPLSPNPVPLVALEEAVSATGSVSNVASLQGARSVLPQGALRHLTSKPISLELAREVLEAPDVWPADIVLLADRRIALKRAGSLLPVASVAASDRWFTVD